MARRTLATLGALLAGLALAGAPAAQAGDAAVSSTSPLATDWLSAAPLLPDAGEPSTCRAEDAAARSARAGTAAKIARIRAMLAAEAAAQGGEGEVVVLGNRGYNYDSSAVVDPSLVEFEARRLSR